MSRKEKKRMIEDREEMDRENDGNTLNRSHERTKQFRLTGSLAAKIVAICLVIVSVVTCVASAAAIIAADYLNVYSEDEAVVLDRFNEKLLDRYSVYAIANIIDRNGNVIKDSPVQKELDQTNFRYGIIRTDDFSSVDLNDQRNYLVGNIDREITADDVNVYSCNWSAYTACDYDMNLFGYAYINNYPAETCEEQRVDGYFYDWMNETLYIKVGEHLYPYIGEIFATRVMANSQTYVPSERTEDEAVPEDTGTDTGTDTGAETEFMDNAPEEPPTGVDENTEYVEIYDEGETTYTTEDPENAGYMEEYAWNLLDNSWLNDTMDDWRSPSMLIMLSNSGQYLRQENVMVVDDQMLYEMGEVSDYRVDYVSAGMAMVPIMPQMDASNSYYIISYAKDPLDIKADFDDCDLLAQAKLLADFAFAYRYVFVAVLLLSILLLIASFVFLLCAAGHRNGVEGLCKRPWDAIPVDVNICGVLCVDAILACAVVYVGEEWNPLKYLVFWLFTGGVGILAILLLIECSMSFALWCKLGKWWQHTLICACAKWCWKAVKILWVWICRLWRRFIELMHSVRFLWKAWLILGAIACVELLAMVLGAETSLEIQFIFWLVEKLILYPVIVFALLQMNRLQEGSRTLAQGDLTSKIDTSKMYWEFKKHGDNLNAIGDGMNAAVAERMKSEHFKTELITNVSHDIKTPLTSIINYVDLLGKEQLDNPKAVEYLEVLSRQSARLKKLIEDLIEASKASTGNLKVNMEVCDAQVTLVQTIGEYEEKLAQGQIQLQIKEPEEQIRIQADSRHLWRVFDNLMNNICKYAQPGTRAYVNLEQVDGQARITFRNISREPLNITSEELMERFVRGDSSRSMEGNGLGLSIARSLTELMGGKLELTVDGDLFKVVLTFPVIND